MTEDADPSPMLDCFIIRGGPAGLAAATFLARFRRRIMLADGGSGRASPIPVSHNCPGSPEGIEGTKLGGMGPMRAATVTGLRRGPRGFTVESDEHDGSQPRHRVSARTVPRATGLVDVHPPISGLRDAIRQGLVRCCPICRGREAVDRRIAALGLAKGGMREATFVSGCSRDATLLALTPMVDVTKAEVRRMRDAGVTVVEAPVSAISVQGGRVAVRMSDGRDLRFDTPYSALGSTPRSELARALGAEADDKAMLVADEHPRTSVTGLWSAGDVVNSLDQIGVAVGRAATAPVDSHDALRECERSADS